MIHELKTLTPYIVFNGGVTLHRATAGQAVNVWLETLYNAQAYTFTLTAVGGTVTKISGYEYRVTYTSPGAYSIYITVNSADKKISLKSNILEINID